MTETEIRAAVAGIVADLRRNGQDGPFEVFVPIDLFEVAIDATCGLAEIAGVGVDPLSPPGTVRVESCEPEFLTPAEFRELADVRPGRFELECPICNGGVVAWASPDEPVVKFRCETGCGAEGEFRNPNGLIGPGTEENAL